MSAKQLKLQSVLPVTIFKEGKMFVAYTPALDLSSCGKTFKEAHANFKEAADIFFRECVRHGTLDDVLASLGWRKTSKPPGWRPPEIVGHVNIPIPTSV